MKQSLLSEARNPEIVTFGLAWGVPGWIGNGTFFSEDNIFYHVSWLKCIKETLKIEIDYLGIWNERDWGAVWYVYELAAAIKAANLTTQLVMLDAAGGSVPADFLNAFEKDEHFQDLVAAVGLHYPCTGNEKLFDALRPHPSTRFWSSEETSTVADWGGAGCWGRMINQNYVRMNATSSIAWSLIWSVYPNLECFGNGLLYAFEPWSGHYEVMAPVWMTAHTTQFTKLGWEYLPPGQGAGNLPEGGTYVTIASRDLKDFTVVLETLQGSCMYNGGCFHTVEANRTQSLQLQLSSKLADAALGRALEVWATNSTHWFQRLADTQITKDGLLRIEVPVDAIVTISTLGNATKAGQRKASPGLDKEVPPAKPFPLPFLEDFESQPLRRAPAFFADQGGAFEVVEAPAPFDATPDQRSIARSLTTRVLEQQITEPPIGWGPPTQPLTLLGDVNWTDLETSVAARFESPKLGLATPLVPFGHGASSFSSFDGPAFDVAERMKSAPPVPTPRQVVLCLRAARYTFFGSGGGQPEGYCLRIIQNNTSSRPAWLLTIASTIAASGFLSPESAQEVMRGGWLHLKLKAYKARISASVEGTKVAEILDVTYPLGQVGLGCGYHKCQFDKFEVRPASEESKPDEGLLESIRPLLKVFDPVTFHYNARSCDPSPTPTKQRTDFTGMIGFAFVPEQPVAVIALGRMVLRGSQSLYAAHSVELLELDEVAGLRPLAVVAVSTLDAQQAGFISTDEGFHYAQLRKQVLLQPNKTYVLASSELQSGDAFFDKAVLAEPSEGLDILGPVYTDAGTWRFDNSPNLLYGPLNALLVPAKVKALEAALDSSNDSREAGNDPQTASTPDAGVAPTVRQKHPDPPSQRLRSKDTVEQVLAKAPEETEPNGVERPPAAVSSPQTPPVQPQGIQSADEPQTQQLLDQDPEKVLLASAAAQRADPSSEVEVVEDKTLDQRQVK
ncbi:galc [Symbiodinium pilosum]|uniref:Galc protein n=1 Tax=Symbiodinium pilosum TaxID=2952 RepID=A0A812N3A0_SYMPI|nr:galc [Symbiodinium pilosum]